MKVDRLTIGTRGSALALAQTDLVRTALISRSPGLDVRVERITTKGDRLLDQPLADIGDKGLFVAEIEQALQTGRIDLAVHSAKDLPTDLPATLALAAFPPRADPRDVLVSRAGTLAALPPGARIGTSSPRRACQIAAVRPDLSVVLIRGNVDSRLAKVAAGEYDAIVLAAAGLIRLGRADAVTEWLPHETMLPAVGQGALALQIRAADARTRALVAPLGHRPTELAVLAERAFLRRLGAGCSAAAGAHAVVDGSGMELTGLIGHVDGRHVRGTRSTAARPSASASSSESPSSPSPSSSSPAEADALGHALARDLLDAGGSAFMAAAERAGAWAE